MIKKKDDHKKPLVTVILPVKDERLTIRECVLSLSRQSYPVECVRIIVIVDAGGDMRIKDDLDAMGIKNLSVVKNDKRGAAAARNLGLSLSETDTEFFSFTDADCIVSEHWISNLINAITSLPMDIGCIGGINLTPNDGPVISRLIGTIEQTLIGGGGSAQGSAGPEIRRVHSIPNCNALYRAQWWIDNKQDETLIVGQDGEFNYRLEKKGCRFVVIPNAEVRHHRPGSLLKHAKRMWRYGSATARIGRKHPGLLLIRWYVFPSVLLVSGSIILAILGNWWPLAWTLLSGALSLYVTLLLLTMFQIFIRSGMWQSLIVPFLLLVQHCAYGMGFIHGWMGSKFK